MSVYDKAERCLSLAKKRFAFWDAESRARSLEDWESRELERAWHDMRRSDLRDGIRAQAAPPGSSRRRAAR